MKPQSVIGSSINSDTQTTQNSFKHITEMQTQHTRPEIKGAKQVRRQNPTSHKTILKKKFQYKLVRVPNPSLKIDRDAQLKVILQSRKIKPANRSIKLNIRRLNKDNLPRSPIVQPNLASDNVEEQVIGVSNGYGQAENVQVGPI